MQDQHSDSPSPRFGWLRRSPFSLAAAVTAIALAGGSGTAWWVMNSAKAPAPVVSPTAPSPQAIAPPAPAAPQTSSEPGIAQSPTAPTATPAAPTAEQTVQVYWLKDEGGQLKLVAAPIAVTAEQPEARLRSALEALLNDAPASDAASTIPQGTQLRSVEIRPDGVHVDLSADFKVGGGSTSMSGRLGQIVYTATTIDPGAKVWISIDGEPLEVLGGEGLIVDQPMTRQSFDENFVL
ncbi:GerMN domain-containing protein [Microcoleus sp. FACHB-1515]|uniref:GerMN domain-containing protein n=1 Tax=Cyanophyceae TaxID=3028117 RepID=UPI0016863C3A|nr:GerMN domain-containing protein [Microcoleus sp. FACHB-1515]MBD2088969.1 GerMN domain-containing protein [Microcoleus sp. FACHB-1515]